MADRKQVRRPSVLGHAILQLLTRRASSGYDLKKRFFASIGHGWHAYDTQIYRELKSLEEGGYVVGRFAPGRSGPQRRLYTITEAGRKSLEQWLVSELDVVRTKDEFGLRVWTADLYPPDTFPAFIRMAREQWAQALQHAQMSYRILVEEHGEPDSTAESAILGRQLAIDMTVAGLEAKIAWADRTLKVLRRRASYATDVDGDELSAAD